LSADKIIRDTVRGPGAGIEASIRQ